MGKNDFRSTEKRLRKRKNPIYLANVVDTSYYDDNYLLHDRAEVNSINKHPKDLAELIYRMFIKKEGSAIVYDFTCKPKTKAHCSNNRLRSLLDLFTICINYVPDIKYKQLYDIVEDLKHDGADYNGAKCANTINSQYCTTTYRTVHFPGRLGIKEEEIRKKIGDKNIIF